MEVALVLWRFGVASVIDFEPVSAWLFAQVGNRQARRTFERHRDVAVASGARGGRIGEFTAPVIDRKQGRMVPLGQTEANAEEIANGDLDAGLVSSDVVAELCDAPRSVNLGEDEGLAGLEPAPIVVSSGGISRSDSVRLEVVEGGQIFQGEILGLGKQTGAKKDSQRDS